MCRRKVSPLRRTLGLLVCGGELLFVCLDDDDDGLDRPSLRLSRTSVCFRHLKWLIDLRCNLSCREVGHYSQDSDGQTEEDSV